MNDNKRRIYIGHGRDGSFIEEIYRPIKGSSFFSNCEVIFPHDDDTLFNSEKDLKGVDLFIAEVSNPATGLGIELGFAHLYGTRIVCLFKAGSAYSESLEKINCKLVEYQDSTDFVEKVGEEIELLDLEDENARLSTVDINALGWEVDEEAKDLITKALQSTPRLDEFIIKSGEVARKHFPTARLVISYYYDPEGCDCCCFNKTSGEIVVSMPVEDAQTAITELYKEWNSMPEMDGQEWWSLHEMFSMDLMLK